MTKVILLMKSEKMWARICPLWGTILSLNRQPKSETLPKIAKQKNQILRLWITLWISVFSLFVWIRKYFPSSTCTFKHLLGIVDVGINFEFIFLYNALLDFNHYHYNFFFPFISMITTSFYKPLIGTRLISVFPSSASRQTLITIFFFHFFFFKAHACALRRFFEENRQGHCSFLGRQS